MCLPRLLLDSPLIEPRTPFSTRTTLLSSILLEAFGGDGHIVSVKNLATVGAQSRTPECQQKTGVVYVLCAELSRAQDSDAQL